MRTHFFIITFCSFSIFIAEVNIFASHAPVIGEIRPGNQKILPPSSAEKKEILVPVEIKNPGDDIQKWQEDLFTMVPTEHKKAFQPVLEIFNRGEVERAISETRTLAKKPALAETAAFLLTDFYLRRWETIGGEGTELKEVFDTFELALRQHSRTENADRMLLKRGNVYLANEKYTESMGSFNRVLINSSQKKLYAATAQVGLLKAHKGLRRPDEILRGYPDLSGLNPSITSQQVGAFLYADALFEMGRFNEAYLRFQATVILLPGTLERMIKYPDLYFHYGEAAFRTGRSAEAKEIFHKLYKKYPDHQVAPMSIGFLSRIIRSEGDAKGAQSFADKLYLLDYTHPTARIGKIVAATGRLASMDCPEPCKSETIKQSIRHVEAESRSLFAERPFQTTAQIAVLDGLVEIRRHVSFETAEGLYEEMIPILPALSPYLPYAQSYLNQTVLEHLERISDAQEVIALYHRFRKAFHASIMRDAVGFKVAKSHMELGLLADAIEYFKPIAGNSGSPHAEEAFYYMGTLLAQMGRFPDAQNLLETFMAKYPKRKDVLLPIGDVYLAQEKIPKAVGAYAKWLDYHPKHDDRKVVYKKLAEIYRTKKETDNEIKIYQKWMAEEKEDKKRPYIGLSDAYFQKKNYTSAIEYYQRALKVEKEKKEVDWVKLRLGASFEAIGKKEEAEKMFKQVSKEAKTAIIKKTAQDKKATMSQEKKRLEEALAKEKTLVAKSNPTKNGKDPAQVKKADPKK
ncbi:MAG: tetratricopeptide repeat protein [Nitrospirota bacterium]